MGRVSGVQGGGATGRAANRAGGQPGGAETLARLNPRLLIALLVAAGFGLAALSWLQPQLYIRTLQPALLLLPIALVALAYPSLALAGVILIVPLSPGTLLPFGASQAIALTKIGGIGAAGLCALRYGLSRQFNGPALAFFAAAVLASIGGSPLSNLTFAESVRSLIGGIAPFAFISARYNPRAYPWLILVVMGGPLASVLLSIIGAPIGIGDGPFGGGRLDGMVHPANLASLSVTAITAATLELVRGNRNAMLWLGVNAIILFGSGARVPLLLAMAFGVGVLMLSRTAHFRFGHKVRLTALALPLLLVVGVIFGQRIIQRSFTDHSGRAGLQLSGRDIIWELFIAVIAKSPWFGYGTGAGRFAVNIEEVALLGTNAAHNEYLRLAVDFGVVGVGLLLLGFWVWITRETQRMPPGQAVVMRAAAVLLALHSISDNTLIALSMVVRVFWFALVFDRARTEAAQAPRRTQSVMRSSVG